MNIKKLLVLTVLVLLPFSVTPSAFAQQGTPATNNILTPDNPFYFLESVKERIQELLTFSPEAKAKLNVEFAKQRLAELQVLLNKQSVPQETVKAVETGLETSLSNVATVLETEKQSGKDVAPLAKTLSGEIHASKDTFHNGLAAQIALLKAQEKDLEKKIDEAKKLGNTAAVETLSKQLKAIEAQIDLLKNRENEQEQLTGDEENKIEEQMGLQAEVTEKIAEIEKEKTEYLAELNREGKTLPAGAFGMTDGLVAEARAALAKGGYEEAKKLLNQAEKSFDAVDKALDKLDRAKEKEQSLREDLQEHQKEEVKTLQTADKNNVKNVREELKKDEAQIRGELQKATQEKTEAEKRLQETEKEN